MHSVKHCELPSTARYTLVVGNPTPRSLPMDAIRSRETSCTVACKTETGQVFLRIITTTSQILALSVLLALGTWFGKTVCVDVAHVRGSGKSQKMRHGVKPATSRSAPSWL